MTGLQWFKIYEDGLGSDGKWAVDKLITNKGKVSFNIPSCIAAGEYLLRVELIGAFRTHIFFSVALYLNLYGLAQLFMLRARILELSFTQVELVILLIYPLI